MGRVAGILVRLAAAAAVAAAALWAFLPRPVPAEYGLVTRGPLEVTVDEDAVTRVRDRYVVSAPLGGTLLRIHLRPGDDVAPGGPPVAVLEPPDPALLDARERAQADARVLAAEAAALRAGADVALAETRLEAARADLARLRELAERRAVGVKELDDAVLLDRQRSEERRAARFAEDVARFELELARAALRWSQAPFGEGGAAERFAVRAPVEGRVLRVFQESAGVVAAGAPLIEVGRPEELEVVVDVLSEDAVRIRPGAPVRLDGWGGADLLEGTVRRVEPSARTKVSALGVEEQRVDVLVDLPDPPAGLGDGFRVVAHVIVWRSEDTLRVPAGALFRHGPGWAVFRVEEGRARLTQVRIGARDDASAEVLGGLAHGDRVVVHPGDAVADGVEVREQPR